jgi:hypothetical protein
VVSRAAASSASQGAAQGKRLLDHLNIEWAHLVGGCMGCGPAMAYPNATLSMVMYRPVGGAKHRINGQQRLAEHLTYVEQHGLEQVVRLVTEEGKPFNGDARGGPWAPVIRQDRALADSLVRQNLDGCARHPIHVRVSIASKSEPGEAASLVQIPRYESNRSAT